MLTYPPPPAGEDGEEKPGDKYEGEMSHGKRHGKGKYTWGVGGATYEGDYVEGTRAGKGAMAYPDKSRFAGAFADNVPHGEGVYTYANGDQYKGTWVAGKKTGTGAYVFAATGAQYIGEWADGGFTSGMFVARDGSVFKGTFEQSLPKEGKHFFARSGLVTAGRYGKSGAWKGGEFHAGKGAGRGVAEVLSA